MSQTLRSFRTIGNVLTTTSANESALDLTNAIFNAVVGSGAFVSNTSGIENTVIGTSAMQVCTDAYGVVAVGCLASQKMVTASGAVMLGDRVCPVMSSGFDSLIIGSSAGLHVESANGCVVMGPNTGSPIYANVITDDVVIGSRAFVSGTGVTAVGARSTSSGDASISVGYSNFHDSAGGITIGAFNSNSHKGSIVIGQGLSPSMSNSLSIVAGAGTGPLNIQNILTGASDTSGAFNVSVAAITGSLNLTSATGTLLLGGLTADQMVSPSVTVSPDVPGATRWTITSVQNASTSSWSDLTMTSSHGTQVTFCDDFVPGILNFTAQHRCVMDGGRTALPGSVLIATGAYAGLDGSSLATMDEAIPIVSLCTIARDPRVFGVMSSRETTDRVRTFRIGSMGFSLPRRPSDQSRVIVNSGGEGCILVCAENGPICNGDLLASSSCDGIAMRQGDDFVRSFTVAKATCACSFQLSERILIGCVYMC